MKLVTAFSTVALVLAPAVGLAQAPGGAEYESTLKGKVEQAIGKIKGSSSEGEKSGNQNAAPGNPDNTSYPDRGAIKRTDK
jgi:hypothetical protein